MELSRTENKIDKFWTITTVNTTHCNDRSPRFVTKTAAIEAAKSRLRASTAGLGVVVMEAVALVEPEEVPFQVFDIK